MSDTPGQADALDLGGLQHFARFVRQQCQFVVMGVDGVHEARAKRLHARDLRRTSRVDPQPADLDTPEAGIALDAEGERELWYSAQAALSAAANVAKALWGDRREPAAQRLRAPVRQALAVDEQSPMFTVRRTRNKFDHYDEELEELAKRPGRRVFIEGLTADQTEGVELDAFFRQYNAETDTIAFRDREVALGPLRDEAVRLIRAAEVVEAQPDPTVFTGGLPPQPRPSHRGWPA